MRVYFKEEQQYKRSHVVIFISLVSLVSLVPLGIWIYRQIILGESWGNKPMSDTGLVITFILVFLLILAVDLLFIFMKFIVEVRDDGIYYRYLPFINKPKAIKKSEINKYEIRNFRPVTEYGGHGIRTNKSKYGKAFTVKGKTGLQLYLNDRTKLLLGTQRPEKLLRAVNKIMDSENNKESTADNY